MKKNWNLMFPCGEPPLVVVLPFHKIWQSMKRRASEFEASLPLLLGCLKRPKLIHVFPGEFMRDLLLIGRENYQSWGQIRLCWKRVLKFVLSKNKHLEAKYENIQSQSSNSRFQVDIFIMKMDSFDNSYPVRSS